MSKRIHNFSAGPATLPLPVLERARDELVDFAGTGMSLMEMSHRSKPYIQVHDETIANLKELMGIPSGYSVIFMGGGARTQFTAHAMNLLVDGKPGAYVTTGTWSEGALKEGKKIGECVEVYSSAESGHDHVPDQAALNVPSNASYLHYTSNNTIFGTEFQYTPEVPSDVPLVCDMSSNIISRKIDVSKFGLIYAGAQKNLGPSGVTVVIVRDDLLERCKKSLPQMMNYQGIADKNSMLNTPPCYPIYMVGLSLKYWKDQGGMAKVESRNKGKADTLYKVIDDSNGFYKGHAKADSRSWMNVTFRLGSDELQAEFLKGASERDMDGLKGHRSVGGIRASIYNALEPASVDALAEYMREFASKRS